MARHHLPTTMKPVSAAQLAIDAQRGSQNTAGSLSLRTNRGNTIQYINVAGVASLPVTVVKDTGENVAGDGMVWIVEFIQPVLTSGMGDAGLKAKIILGEGGANETILANVYPGFVLAVPSTSIDVQIFSDTPAASVQDGTFAVTAIIYRGVPADAGNAHYSQLITTSNGTELVPIPNYARAVRFYGDEAAAAIFTAPSHAIIDGGSAGNIADYSAATLLAQFKAGDSIILPGGAQNMRLIIGAAGIPFWIDFDIEL